MDLAIFGYIGCLYCYGLRLEYSNTVVSVRSCRYTKWQNHNYILQTGPMQSFPESKKMNGSVKPQQIPKNE